MGKTSIMMMMMMNQGLFVLVSLLFSSAAGSITEYDDYWRQREAHAFRALEELYEPDPFNITNQFNMQSHQVMKELNKLRRALREDQHNDDGPCTITNPIDACWRCQANWAENRKRLADCAVGFAKGTTGGKAGEIYVVTEDTDEDLLNPKPGTLRYGVIQSKPLWIIFDRSMDITLQQELLVNSHKTIDARGVHVNIQNGAGITLQYVQNIIIHGLYIHDILPGNGGMIRDSIEHFGFRTQSDGDAISIFGGSRIWIDHCSLSRGSDGLIDIIQGSAAIAITNNHMTHHNDVFLFGATDDYTNDQKMQITVAFNHFGKGLVQRMPRCRYGFIHVVNNDYTHWIMYAIGGSQGPTIVSQGNRFIAPDSVRSKEVTHRVAGLEEEWKQWTWISQMDQFENGAYFTPSGAPAITDARRFLLIPAQPGTEVHKLTKYAGPRKCVVGQPC